MYKIAVHYKKTGGFANPLILLLFIIAIVAIVGVGGSIKNSQDLQSRAQTLPTNSIYLNPSSQTTPVNSQLSVTIRVNAVENVNAVQADISYPVDKLTVTNIDTSMSAFDVAAQGEFSNGLIKIARGALTPVSGDNIFAVVHFQTNNTAGQADLIFAPTTQVISSTTNTNILSQVTGGAYVITPPQISPTPNTDTEPPQVSITSLQNNTIVSRKSQVTIAANASDNVAVSKVVFSVNGAVLCTDAAAPYACNWKVGGKPNAQYVVEARAFDAANNSGTTSIRVTAK